VANCKHFRKRSKNYTNYFYCTTLKKETTFEDCQNCKYKEYKKVKPLKQRSFKQNKLERNRYSIFTNNFERCIECGKKATDKHEIYRGKNRHTSIKWGLVIPLCRTCHNDPEIEQKWRIKGQQKFMQHYDKTIDEFIKIFGKNYLDK
jgi:hypothetical protein